VRGLYLDRKNLPSYIPARNFALALMDLIAPQGAKGATLSSPVSTTNSVVVVNAQQQMPPSQPAGAANSAAAIDALRKGINDSVASHAVKRGLLALVDASGSDAAKLRENIENWYNSSMDRVAGWYKRRIQWIILALGVLLAVVLNADSVIVSQALWKNAALRSGVVKAAEDLNAHYVKTSSLPATSDTSAAPADQSTLTPEQQGEQYNRKLQSLGLPIGWNNQDEAHRLPDGFLKSPVHFLSLSVHQLDLHWLGWLITGLAISLGAPFWFDLLNKIIVVRSTVKPREKSPDEASKA
jgi:hypothetical protein